MIWILIRMLILNAYWGHSENSAVMLWILYIMISVRESFLEPSKQALESEYIQRIKKSGRIRSMRSKNSECFEWANRMRVLSIQTNSEHLKAFIALNFFRWSLQSFHTIQTIQSSVFRCSIQNIQNINQILNASEWELWMSSIQNSQSIQRIQNSQSRMQ